jgi:hypothetical protein
MSFLLAVLFAATSLTPDTSATQWFKKSVVTLTDMSEVPGMVLEPGTYVFRADESNSNQRTIVELLNQDETQVLASFVAVPDHRQRPEMDTIVTFYKGVTSGPKPIRTWYYIGDMNGYEFVYPKTRAKEIAKVTEDHVMSSESKGAAIVAITQNGTEVPVFDALVKDGAKTHAGETTREKPQAAPPAPKRKPRR